MARSQSDTYRAIDSSSRVGLKAPGLLTFLFSQLIMITVLFAKYFGAAIPGLSGDVTQFAGLLIAYLILAMACIFRAF